MKQYNHFRQQDAMSDPGIYRGMIPDSMNHLQAVVQSLQQVLIHQAWAQRYGVVVTELRKQETDIKRVEDKLAWLHQQGLQDLSQSLPEKRRMFAICRDYALMICSLSRHLGYPARTRCGFATYLEVGKYVDHWICEVYDLQQSRWRQVDAQIDTLQKNALSFQADCLDLTPGFFINAAEAWRACRNQELDANRFGIFTWWGWDYLVCNLLLDANALCGVPMHPWDDGPALKRKPAAQLNREEFALLDNLAKRILEIDVDPDAFFAWMAQHPELKMRMASDH